MKRNKIAEECRKLITPEIKRKVDKELSKANRVKTFALGAVIASVFNKFK